MALIQLTNVSKKFIMGQEEILALDKINLEIREGEFLSIVGKSGSGKSTLMNILGLLDKPTEGVFRFRNQPVTSLSDNELSNLRNQMIGFVFQSFNLLPRASALKNVEMPLIYSEVFSKGQRVEMAKAALDRVQLSNRFHHKPNELSGGQRQRVAIARAIVNRPKIILADEPTGSLDSKTGQEILDLFAELNEREGVCVILVTHDQHIAQRTKRILTMTDGRLHVLA